MHEFPLLLLHEVQLLVILFTFRDTVKQILRRCGATYGGLLKVCLQNGHESFAAMIVSILQTAEGMP